MENKIIKGQTFDEERSLYHLTDSLVEDCVFAGPADGESVLKEARRVSVKRCSFSLRYPLWHTQDFLLQASTMDTLTRAPIWYASNGVIDACVINGIKCLRECDNITLKNSRVVSPEFGWRCRGLTLTDSICEAEYFLFESRDVTVDGLKMKGKYSFQYVENMTIRNAELDTKDAFWHSKNVTVENSLVKGEYLGWYSENLTLKNCHIVGTQPLCYCKGLSLIDCTTEGCDLAFEYSEVTATINGAIDSIKNPASGRITVQTVGEIVCEDSVMENECEIISRDAEGRRVITRLKNNEKNVYIN